MIRKRIGCLALCLILFCGICSAFADGNSAAGGPGGKRIGIQMGSVFDQLVLEVLSSTFTEQQYFYTDDREYPNRIILRIRKEKD